MPTAEARTRSGSGLIKFQRFADFWPSRPRQGFPLPRYRKVSVGPRAEMPYLGLRGKYRSKMLVMNAMTPEDARAYFNRWELVRDAEAAELRRATMETKLQQLAALMVSRHLFGPEPDREAQLHEVRDRWNRLRRAPGG
jgi:hypothetical protein